MSRIADGHESAWRLAKQTEVVRARATEVERLLAATGERMPDELEAMLAAAGETCDLLVEHSAAVEAGTQSSDEVERHYQQLLEASTVATAEQQRAGVHLVAAHEHVLAGMVRTDRAGAAVSTAQELLAEVRSLVE